MEASVAEYINALQTSLRHGEATEHTHRPAFKQLIEALAPGVTATNEPKRAVDCGAPDFSISRDGNKLGIVETKDIGLNLAKIEKSEQLQRYLGAFPNLILTDYLDFRWYVNGQLRQQASLGALRQGRIAPDAQGAQSVATLLVAFCRHESEFPATPDDLAKRMAEIARMIRVSIEGSLKRESPKLLEQLEGFRDVLLHDLTETQFADMYAQTICYGMFAARCWMERPGVPRGFSRARAGELLPKTNPFLRKVFSVIAGPDLDEGVRWAVDDVAELLRRAKMAAVLEDFGRRTRQEDPVVHFYETFLAAYDPKLREARGVYYTPEPVVSYIVRSVDHILRTDFGLEDGLADSSKIKLKDKDGKESESHRVLILDPATGTGTFLHGVVDEIYARVTEKHGKGVWSQYTREHLLPRLFGFELLMAPYAVAHMKLGIQLNELGYDFADDERLGVFLTNTLEEARKISDLIFARWLSDEAQAASAIKRDLPIMVVLGNPPYSGHSVNTGDWIKNLLRGKDTLNHAATGNYFECDGKPLGERNPKWLNDDYVKFIRFAQWRIEQTGHGILAFISNNGYLDNPTFRGMRQSLMQTFDDIYIVDLHGNSKKKERAPDGGKDENVFDIQQGVCIGIFVKRKESTGRKQGVRHAEQWGLREVVERDGDDLRVVGGKYQWLNTHDVSNTKWKRPKPEAPYYLFVPRDTAALKEYETSWRVTDAMPVSSLGIATARDRLCVDFDKDVLLRRVHDFSNTGTEDARAKYNLRQDTKDWTVAEAQRDVQSVGVSSRFVQRIAYRPFDDRFTYFTGTTRGFLCRPRSAVMNHFLAGKNIGLVTTRSIEIGRGWEHLFCANTLVQLHSVSLKEVNYCFPLYLYPNGKPKGDLFEHDNGRRPNFSAAFVEELEARLKRLKFIPDGKGDLRKTFGPEDVFHYMYAVLHSPGYRARYAEFLKIDFPRLPLTSSAKLFRKLCGLGKQLVALHVMEQDGPRKAMPKFPVDGDNVVEKVAFVVAEPEPKPEPPAPKKKRADLFRKQPTPPKTAGEAPASRGRVWINGTQYFEPVPPEVWEFHIGGYRVAEKWLKDRKGRKLSFEDLDTYCRIIAALSETMAIMAEIDKAIEAEGGWPIQ